MPVGHVQYQLYCEHELAEPTAPADSSGIFGRLQARFTSMLHEAERRRRAGDAGGPVTSSSGLWDRVMAWVAERVAEQRLLWNLRHESTVRLVHPADMSSAEAIDFVHGELRRDRDRHWRWLAIDGTLLVVSGALALVPGPNLVAYYFAFRVVGHWLSIRGAKHGLGPLTWIPEASEPLRDLRGALALDPAARADRIRDLAAQLHLAQLPMFLARVASRRP